MKYTFTFGPQEETKFQKIMAKLEPDEFTIINEIHPVDPENVKYCDRETVMDMDPEAALTFRLGMKLLKIRRDRTEEELAEEKRINDQHIVKITVKVDGLQGPTPSSFMNVNT